MLLLVHPPLDAPLWRMFEACVGSGSLRAAHLDGVVAVLHLVERRELLRAEQMQDAMDDAAGPPLHRPHPASVVEREHPAVECRRGGLGGRDAALGLQLPSARVA